MKYLIIILFCLFSVVSVAQQGQATQTVYYSSVDGTPADTTNADFIASLAKKVSQGYAYMFWNKQAATDHWDIYTSTGVQHVFRFGSGGGVSGDYIPLTFTGDVAVNADGNAFSQSGSSSHSVYTNGQLEIGGGTGVNISTTTGEALFGSANGPAQINASSRQISLNSDTITLNGQRGVRLDDSFGTDGQVATSHGNGSPITWEDVSAVLSWYNVTQHGLVADGTTDNSTAIATLIASIPVGSTLYFPTGVYFFSSAVQCNKVIHIRGDSRWSSFLKMAANDELLHYTRSAVGVTITDIGFTNSNAGTPTSASIGIRADTANAWTVKNVYIYGFYNNIQLTQVWEDSWDAIYCVGWVNAGMSRTNSSIYTDAGDASIVNSYFIPSTRNSVYSIFQQNGGGTKITNTKFNYGSGFKTQYHYYYNAAGITVDLDISNNSFENYSVAAIRVGRSSGSFNQIAITGNDIGGTSTANVTGIILANIEEATITGNTFRASTANTTAVSVSNVDRIALCNNIYLGWTTNLAQAGTVTNLTQCVETPPLTLTNDNIMQVKSGALTLRTPAQIMTDLGAAPLASPALTGTPTAPTATLGDVSTKIATTAFVDAAMGAAGLVDDFLDLTDTPNSYSGQGSKLVTVKSDASGLEFTTAPSGLTLNGYLSVTGTTTLSTSDFYKTIHCTGTSADYTVTLPAASGNSGAWYRFIGGSAAALTKVITVDANSSELINSHTTRPMGALGAMTIVCDGTGWYVSAETGSWITYTATWTGTSGAPTATTKYSLQGKTMTIMYSTAATAASGTGMTFTLPSGWTISSSFTSYTYARIMSNGSFVSTGIAEATGGATGIALYLNGAGGAIASTSNKQAQGQLIIEID